MKRVRVKVCGITRPEDAEAAVSAGADAIGFIFCESPRRVELGQAAAIRRRLPPFVSVVGVFVNESLEGIANVVQKVGLTEVQLHGDESGELVRQAAELVPVVKALRIRGAESFDGIEQYDAAGGFLFDAFVPGARGGTGHTFNWDLLKEGSPRRPKIPWILAGGLGPENVAEAIATCAPYGVDVSSGVETSPGVKDPEKIERFLERVRRAT